MADTQAFHYACGNDFVKRLLMEWIGAALYKAPCAIDDLPPFFEGAVRRVVRGTEVHDIQIFAGSKQDVADIVGKVVLKEDYLIPRQI